MRKDRANRLKLALMTHSVNSMKLFGIALILLSLMTPSAPAEDSFLITDIEGSEYYGKSLHGDSGIYFTEADTGGAEIKVGDTVLATFNAEDELLAVKEAE